MIKKVVADFNKIGISIKELNISHAFHSQCMDPILDKFHTLLKQIKFKKANIKFVSNLTGNIDISDTITNPKYWVEHLRKSVNYIKGVDSLQKIGVKIFIEIGPKPVLISMAQECLPTYDALWLPSLQAGVSDMRQMLFGVAELYRAGLEINWSTFNAGRRLKRISLPTYPFQQKSYWIDANNSLKLDTSSDGIDDKGWKDWLYELDYLRQDQGNMSAKYLPSPSKIKSSLNKKFKAIALSANIHNYKKTLNDLESFSYEYILKALYELGYTFIINDLFSIEEFAIKYDIKSKHLKLLNRLFDILAEEGILKKLDIVWQVISIPKSIKNSIQSAKPNIHQEVEAESELLFRCGSNLAGVLQGKIDPLQLIFSDGDTTLLKKLYTDSPTLKMMNGLIGESVELIKGYLPKRFDLKVLEIGAGTGSTTSHILPKLDSNLSKYTFSDISRKFTLEAENNFKQYSYINYSQLNIEDDPLSQGFKNGTFDLIIATNVLHATKDLKQSIEHVHKLLAPGGLLILLEGNAPVRWVDLTFGLTEGWWRFDDYAIRPKYPLLSVEQWSKELKSANFDEIASISSKDVAITIGKDGLLPQSIIIAKKNEIRGSIQSPKTWLIFDNREDISHFLNDKLGKDGDKCLLVRPGNKYKKISNTEYVIDPYNKKDFDCLIKNLSCVIYGVIYLWGTDKIENPMIKKEDIERQYLLNCGGVLNLIQSLINHVTITPSLFLVTKGSQTFNKKTELSELLQSSLWGMGRVISIEHPEFKCKMIDLDTTDSSVYEELLDEIKSESDEDQVVFKDEQRYVLRLKKNEIKKDDKILTNLKLKSSGCYLITGGIGGIGLFIAKWMISNGAKCLILVGRSKPDAKIQKHLDELGDDSVKINFIQTDISDKKQVDNLLLKIEKSKLPLNGIVHAAGVIDDGIIMHQNEQRFLKLMQAKILGAWNMHIATVREKINLDFFVMFSSIVGLIGNAGQVNHAAANRFMDGLANYRKLNNLACTTIDWGAWSDIGTLSKKDSVVQKLKEIGINEIDPIQGLEVFKYSILRNCVHIAFAPITWSLFLEKNNLKNIPFFSNFATYAAKNKNELLKETNLNSKIELSKSIKGYNLLLEMVSGRVYKILGFDNNITLDNLDKDFFDYGMDSLTSIQLRNNLQIDLKCQLSPTVAFNYPSIRKLTDYLFSIAFTENESLQSSTGLNQNQSFGISNHGLDISMQQIRWLKLVEKNYGKLLIPILFHTNLKEDVFYLALKEVVERHEILRYKFIDNKAYVVNTDDFLPKKDKFFVDLSNKSGLKQAEAIEYYADSLRSSQTNIEVEPSWKIKCLNLDNNKFLLLLHIQHLEFDGTSISIFVDELRQCYLDFIKSKKTKYVKGKQYSEYIDWQKNYINNDISKDRLFFQNLYKTVDQVTLLSKDSKIEVTESYPSACYTPNQIADIWPKIQNVAKKYKVSNFSVLCLAYAQLISEIVENRKIVIGTIVSSRPVEFEKVIGPFVQPFPINVTINSASKVKTLLQINDIITSINDRSRYPIADLINHVPAFKNLPIDTYFTDSFIMLNNYPKETVTEPKVEVIESLGPVLKPGLSTLTTNKLNEIAGLFLVIDFYEGGVRFNFWYHIHRFTENQVIDWATRYLKLLESIIQELEVSPK